jgi:YceI-like domain
MKNLFVVLVFIFNLHIFGQEKIVSKNSKIYFESLYIKSFQDVKAVNENVTVVLNLKTGEFACLALIKGFRFEVALMEEHFNENYIESNKFPKCVFSGVIVDFDYKKIYQDEKKYNLKGILELHGKKKEMNIIVKIKKNFFDQINIISDFFVENKDHDIIIPSIVKNKISDKISVNFSCTFK